MLNTSMFTLHIILSVTGESSVTSTSHLEIPREESLPKDRNFCLTRQLQREASRMRTDTKPTLGGLAQSQNNPVTDSTQGEKRPPAGMVSSRLIFKGTR